MTKKYCRIKAGYSDDKSDCVMIPVYFPIVVPFEEIYPTIITCRFKIDKKYTIYETRDLIGHFEEYLIKPEGESKKRWVPANNFNLLTEKDLHNEKFNNKIDELLND